MFTWIYKDSTVSNHLCLENNKILSLAPEENPAPKENISSLSKVLRSGTPWSLLKKKKKKKKRERDNPSQDFKSVSVTTQIFRFILLRMSLSIRVLVFVWVQVCVCTCSGVIAVIRKRMYENIPEY